MTVDQFAEKHNIDRNIAYGFLRYLADAGLVRTDKLPQPPGKKGKPAIIYFVDDVENLANRMVEHLRKRFCGVGVAAKTEIKA